MSAGVPDTGRNIELKAVKGSIIMSLKMAVNVKVKASS